ILTAAQVRGHGAALLRLDLNDWPVLHKHGAGARAELLRSFAQRLQGSAGESAVCGRAEDGAEFLVLLTHTNDVYEVTWIIQRTLEGSGAARDFDVESLPGVFLSAALYPHDATSYDELYVRAGEALRRARERDSRIEFASADLAPVSSDLIALERDFRWAAERHQFVLQYQPVFALAVPDHVGGGISDVERVAGLTARPRWPHLERGFIEHAQFRALIEAASRSIALDRWCLPGILEDAADWSDQGWSGWVSLGLSRDSFRDPELPGFVLDCLRRRGFLPNRLVVAIEPGSVLPGDNQSFNVISQLRTAGVRIALDGIGADSASFDKLRYLPADLVFLDSALVDAIGRDLRGEQILQSMVGLTRQMGLACVAREVGDEIQLKWLREAGVELGLGQILGKGASADAIKKLLF
ncbi:MAG: EAL domain-containing protein, partial [Longimicrobiales bacterium]